MPGSGTEAGVRAAFAEQAAGCDRLGSPFTAALCRLLGERIDRSSAVGRRLLEWPGDPAPFADGLPLRLCGGLHARVRRDAASRLAACYPPNALPGATVWWEALRPALDDPELAAWLDQPPQTNEVGRSAVLMAGLLALARIAKQPMALLELGASAGLNLQLDLYGYCLGERTAGDPASALQLQPAWDGPSPPAAEVTIVRRYGVDIQPLDPRRDGERLLAYVWPDQTTRLARLQTALAIAAASPPTVAAGDAAEWLEKKMAEPYRGDATTVVFHSVAFQYFSAETRHRIEAAIEATAAQRPIAWLRYEKLPDDHAFSLRLKTWPGGEDRLHAWVHPHGSHVTWIGGSDPH